MRLMGLDYGSKTIGVALSDELLMTAQPFETIWRDSETKLRKTLARIEEIVKEKNVQTIALGLPLMEDGSEGERVKLTYQFKEKLENRLPGIEIVMVDERYTTAISKEELDIMNVKKSEQKTYIDQLAACYILEEYMSKLKDTDKTKN